MHVMPFAPPGSTILGRLVVRVTTMLTCSALGIQSWFVRATVSVGANTPWPAVRRSCSVHPPQSEAPKTRTRTDQRGCAPVRDGGDH
jgi:hypothetical protein